MRFQKLFFLAAFVSSLTVVPGPGYGQSQPVSTSQSKTPAGTSAPSSPAQGQAAPIPNAKPAKVWTNDDMGTLRQRNGISVVGKNPPKNVNATPKTPSNQLPPKKIRPGTG